jgi:hypothetical protein
LVLFDRLTLEERGFLGALQSDPTFYGVLRPRVGSEPLGVKSVDRDTALLFLTLAEPKPLPQYVASSDAQREVARLLADGVLQVDVGAGFVSGADVIALLGLGTKKRGGGCIASLSRDALRYAQALPIEESWVLADRIYAYNRLPLTPRWHRLLSPRANHASYLQIAEGAQAEKALSRNWLALSPSPSWLCWGASSRRPPAAGGPTYKLYLSPKPEALAGDGFAAIVSALSLTRAFQFKVGAGAAGLLRPDKLVAYFWNFEALAKGASRIRERLDGMPAHGVPFTAQVGGDGLLSWGLDPPPEPGLPGMGADSWRLWLARRLARAIVSARATPEPWRFAVERLRLEGVDTDTWAPGPLVFKEA